MDYVLRQLAIVGAPHREPPQLAGVPIVQLLQRSLALPGAATNIHIPTVPSPYGDRHRAQRPAWLPSCRNPGIPASGVDNTSTKTSPRRQRYDSFAERAARPAWQWMQCSWDLQK